jgi:hypothetical protein
MNSYIAYVCRRVLNSRYTKFGWNWLRGQRVNLEHTDRHTHIHTHTHTHIRFYIYRRLCSVICEVKVCHVDLHTVI